MAKDTENIILETARKHFVQNGYAATRMQDIADEAGINKAMLHYYFRSKEKLYNEIIKHTLDSVMPKFAETLGGGGTFWERLERMVEGYTRLLLKQPEIPMFIMSELSQKREDFVAELKKRVIYMPSVKEFLIVVMQEMQEGKIRQVSPVQLLLTIMGMTVFPFIAKPIFRTIVDISEEEFYELMKERKAFTMDFIRHALRVD